MTHRFLRRAAALLRGVWQHSHKVERYGLGLTFVVCTAVGFLPLFDGPGYEYALACGVVLPSLVAVTTALVSSNRQDRYAQSLERGLAFGFWVAACALSIALFHGLRVGLCDASRGSLLFALGPASGCLLAGVWGSSAGALLRPVSGRKRAVLAILLGLGAPLVSVGVSVWRFYTSPMIFAFDPFVGFFAGALYDTVIAGLDRLQSYRVGSLGSVLAAFALAQRLRRPGPSNLLPRFASFRFKSSALLCLGLVLSLGVTVKGSYFGHYQTAASIAQSLGGLQQAGRCEVVYSRELAVRDVELLGRECDAHVREIESYLQTSGPPKIRVFLFSSAEQKSWLMGAANTYIAKPWRGEIYLQAAGFPHPVLAHELAHVIAGSMARGPFKVAGRWGGWLPDPGRIEGMAVAAAPSDDADLTALEWSKAMLDLKLLPPLESIFGLGFLGQHSSAAYTVAGAFLQFLRDQAGALAVRRWYASESLDQVTGQSLPQWEQRFREYLGTVQISDAALQRARALFERPSVFARRCPHEIDQLEQQAGALLARFDLTGAEQIYAEVLKLDPHDQSAQLEQGSCLLRRGQVGHSAEHYQSLARDPTAHPLQQSVALQRWADVELLRGNLKEAAALYAEAQRSIVDENELRQLDVKEYAASAAAGSLPYQAIVALLIGDAAEGPDWAVASAKLAAWSAAEPEQGMADYLLGRNFWNQGRWQEAELYLDRALSRSIALPRVEREALHARMILACAQGDQNVVRLSFQKMLQEPALSSARKAGLLRLAARCGVPAVTGSETATAAALPTQAPSNKPDPAATGPRCAAGMVLVPGGEFWMGSADNDGTPDDRPHFLTRVPDYCLDETEVPSRAYEQCVEAGQCSVPHGQQITCNYKRPGREDHPINCVDHAQAASFCAAEGKRLPGEVEWEYAAKGGKENREYSWGNEPPEGRTCWDRGTSCKVKSYAPGAFGLYDMTGNVWEWTADYFAPYPWPSADGQTMVYRGGSWSRRFEKWMVTTLRNRFTPPRWGSHLGIRCTTLAAGASCPFGARPDGSCNRGVLAMDCQEGQQFNGVRCAKPGEPQCPEGATLQEGYGCVSPQTVGKFDPAHYKAEMDAVTRTRSPEFDSDCQHYQVPRPNAYRFAGGTGPARNDVVTHAGCKNRDVGTTWNSACCP